MWLNNHGADGCCKAPRNTRTYTPLANAVRPDVNLAMRSVQNMPLAKVVRSDVNSADQHILALRQVSEGDESPTKWSSLASRLNFEKNWIRATNRLPLYSRVGYCSRHVDASYSGQHAVTNDLAVVTANSPR